MSIAIEKRCFIIKKPGGRSEFGNLNDATLSLIVSAGIFSIPLARWFSRTLSNLNDATLSFVLNAGIIFCSISLACRFSCRVSDITDATLLLILSAGICH